MIYKRNELPQLREPDLVDFDYIRLDIAPTRLVPSQHERVPHLIWKAMRKFPTPNPLIVDISNNIVNGHHRYSAALALGVSEVPILQVQTTIEKLIEHFVKNKS